MPMLVDAGKKGVSALDAVSETIGHQEIKGTINGDRARSASLFGNAIHDLVGRHRRMALEHRLEHLSPLLGETQSLIAATLLGASNGATAADLMIVVGIVEQVSLQASNTVYSRPNRPEKD